MLGGDGTLLSVARNYAGRTADPRRQPRTARLPDRGPREELYPALVEILAGRFTLEARSLLEVELVREGADGAPVTGRSTTR